MASTVRPGRQRRHTAAATANAYTSCSRKSQADSEPRELPEAQREVHVEYAGAVTPARAQEPVKLFETLPHGVLVHVKLRCRGGDATVRVQVRERGRYQSGAALSVVRESRAQEILGMAWCSAASFPPSTSPTLPSVDSVTASPSRPRIRSARASRCAFSCVVRTDANPRSGPAHPTATLTFLRSSSAETQAPTCKGSAEVSRAHMRPRCDATSPALSVGP